MDVFEPDVGGGAADHDAVAAAFAVLLQVVHQQQRAGGEADRDVGEAVQQQCGAPPGGDPVFAGGEVKLAAVPGFEFAHGRVQRGGVVAGAVVFRSELRHVDDRGIHYDPSQQQYGRTKEAAEFHFSIPRTNSLVSGAIGARAEWPS